MRILVAEDDQVSNKLLVTNLEKWGHEVISVFDGQSALDLYRDDGPFDVAILDWMMPHMEGPDVCKVIREGDTRSFTYIIMLTAKAQVQDTVHALKVGADDYIIKPFDVSEMKARLNAGARIVILERDLKAKITELEDALGEVKRLQGILPICAWCKKIRDDSDYWSNVEDYFTKHSDTTFTHSICPECLEKRFPD